MKHWIIMAGVAAALGLAPLDAQETSAVTVSPGEDLERFVAVQGEPFTIYVRMPLEVLLEAPENPDYEVRVQSDEAVQLTVVPSKPGPMTVGPFVLVRDSFRLKVNPVKIHVLAPLSLDDPKPGLELQLLENPNIPRLYVLSVRARSPMGELMTRPFWGQLDTAKLPKTVKLLGEGSQVSGRLGQVFYVLVNTADKPVTVEEAWFEELPEKYPFPSMVLQPNPSHKK